MISENSPIFAREEGLEASTKNMTSWSRSVVPALKTSIERAWRRHVASARGFLADRIILPRAGNDDIASAAAPVTAKAKPGVRHAHPLAAKRNP